jgi:hypothetical protein
MSMNLSYTFAIERVEERFKKIHVSGFGKEAVFADESTGWWLTLRGNISLYIGKGDAGYKAGDIVKLTVSKS